MMNPKRIMIIVAVVAFASMIFISTGDVFGHCLMGPCGHMRTDDMGEIHVAFHSKPRPNELTLGNFDKVDLRFSFFNSTLHPLEKVTYRIEFWQSGDLLARNLVYTENHTSVVQVRPVSECTEPELWKCTEYFGTTHPIVQALYALEHPPVISGPIFTQVGDHDILISVEGATSPRTVLYDSPLYDFTLNIPKETTFWIDTETGKIINSTK